MLVADESVDGPIVASLRAEGYEILFIAEAGPGASDDAVLAIANEHGAVLLTEDKDFGEMVFRQGKVTAGVILVRVDGLSERRKAEIVVAALRQLGGAVKRSFTVIAPGLTRVRPVV